MGSTKKKLIDYLKDIKATDSEIKAYLRILIRVEIADSVPRYRTLLNNHLMEPYNSDRIAVEDVFPYANVIKHQRWYIVLEDMDSKYRLGYGANEVCAWKFALLRIVFKRPKELIFEELE